MRNKSIFFRQTPIEFPFNRLPAVLQAEVSKKLGPNEFGHLLCSSKEVSRNIRKYASLSYDTYFFNQQQNLIKNFIKPNLNKKHHYDDNSIFSVYCYGLRSKKVDMVLESIYLFNLNQNQNKKIVFPTEVIQDVIQLFGKIQTMKNKRQSYLNQCSKYCNYEDSKKDKNIEIWLCIIYLMIPPFVSLVTGVALVAVIDALNIALLFCGLVYIAYLVINDYIQKANYDRLSLLIDQSDREISMLEDKLSTSISKLEAILVNLPKDTDTLDSMIKEETHSPSQLV